MPVTSPPAPTSEPTEHAAPHSDAAVEQNNGKKEMLTWSQVLFNSSYRHPNHPSAALSEQKIRRKISQRRLCIIKCIIRILAQATTVVSILLADLSTRRVDSWAPSRRVYTWVDLLGGLSTNAQPLTIQAQISINRKLKL